MFSINIHIGRCITEEDDMMTDTVKFTIRADQELLKKFHFVADYHARSANRELVMLMKKHIAEFEKKHGEICPE